MKPLSTAALVLRFALVTMITAPVSLLAQSAAEPAASPRKDVELRTLVSALEDSFLERLDSAPDLERLYDDYEAKLKALIAQHPGRPEPYVGFSELFEKCGDERTRRLLDEILRAAHLPENLRKFYSDTRTSLQLIGTPISLGLETLGGGSIDLRDYRGKVLLIDFWATWCGPCVKEIPKLQGYYAESHSAGLEIVSVSFDDDRAKLDKFLQTRGLPWTQVHAVGGQREAIAQALGVTRGILPTVFLVGRDGRIRHTLNTRFRLHEKIAALLREP